jgi:hypothetical protein
LSRLRDLLALLMAVQQMREPISSPAGLRQAIELLARLAELLGIDPAWIERLRAILSDEHVFNIVLAIVQYLLFVLWDDDEVSVLDFSTCEVDAQSFADWFPLVVDLLTLWRILRGA